MGQNRVGHTGPVPEPQEQCSGGTREAQSHIPAICLRLELGSEPQAEGVRPRQAAMKPGATPGLGIGLDGNQGDVLGAAYMV